MVRQPQVFARGDQIDSIDLFSHACLFRLACVNFFLTSVCNCRFNFACIWIIKGSFLLMSMATHVVCIGLLQHMPGQTYACIHVLLQKEGPQPWGLECLIVNTVQLSFNADGARSVDKLFSRWC
jgi:hypothetical protein